MDELEKKISSEVKRLSKTLNKCQSRWVNGYVDALKDVLKWMGKEKEDGIDSH